MTKMTYISASESADENRVKEVALCLPLNHNFNDNSDFDCLKLKISLDNCIIVKRNLFRSKISTK